MGHMCSSSSSLLAFSVFMLCKLHCVPESSGLAGTHYLRHATQASQGQVTCGASAWACRDWGLEQLPESGDSVSAPEWQAHAAELQEVGSLCSLSCRKTSWKDKRRTELCALVAHSLAGLGIGLWRPSILHTIQGCHQPDGPAGWGQDKLNVQLPLLPLKNQKLAYYQWQHLHLWNGLIIIFISKASCKE